MCVPLSYAKFSQFCLSAIYKVILIYLHWLWPNGSVQNMFYISFFIQANIKHICPMQHYSEEEDIYIGLISFK